MTADAWMAVGMLALDGLWVAGTLWLARETARLSRGVCQAQIALLEGDVKGARRLLAKATGSRECWSSLMGLERAEEALEFGEGRDGLD